MSRYLYSNLLKIIFGSLIIVTLIPSFVYLVCFLFIDKNLNLTSLLFTISCVVLWALLIIIVNVINKTAKNRIVFEEGKIRYKGMTIYANNVSIKYFKFYVSLIEPSLVIPKVRINAVHFSLTCYFSKRDIKKIEKLNFKVKKI